MRKVWVCEGEESKRRFEGYESAAECLDEYVGPACEWLLITQSDLQAAEIKAFNAGREFRPKEEANGYWFQRPVYETADDYLKAKGAEPR